MLAFTPCINPRKKDTWQIHLQYSLLNTVYLGDFHEFVKLKANEKQAENIRKTHVLNISKVKRDIALACWHKLTSIYPKNLQTFQITFAKCQIFKYYFFPIYFSIASDVLSWLTFKLKFKSAG